MSAERSTNWLNIALLLGVGYVVIRYVLPVLQTAMSGASAAVNATGSGIASVYSSLALPPPIAVNTSGRGVNMPDGSVIALASFQQVLSSPDSTQLYGTWNGVRYTISGPLDANGNYTAS